MFAELQHLMLWNPHSDASFYFPLVPAPQGNYPAWVTALALPDPAGSAWVLTAFLQPWIKPCY